LNDGIRHLVGMPLVPIANLADTPFQLYASALLDHMRRLVSGRMKTRRTGERDVVAGRVRLGADRAARDFCGAADVGLDAADVVAAEQALDRLAVR
jgi:hypothetical protein